MSFLFVLQFHNEGNHLNDTSPHKSDHQIEIKVQTVSQKMKVVPTTEKGHSLSLTQL